MKRKKLSRALFLFACFVSSHIQVLSVIKKGLMKMFPRAV